MYCAVAIVTGAAFGKIVSSLVANIFRLVAFVIFLVIKAINHAQDAFDGDEEEEAEKLVEPPEDIRLLREIRDSLQGR